MLTEMSIEHGDDNDLLSHCDKCDLTFCGLHVTWFSDCLLGESECPICGESLDVLPEPEMSGYWS